MARRFRRPRRELGEGLIKNRVLAVERPITDVPVNGVHNRYAPPFDSDKRNDARRRESPHRGRQGGMMFMIHRIVANAVRVMAKRARAIVVVAMCLSATAASAATYSVTNPVDTNNPADVGTLRWALAQATTAGDVVDLQVDVTLVASLPAITTSIIVDGDGPRTIDGAGTYPEPTARAAAAVAWAAAVRCTSARTFPAAPPPRSRTLPS
jgi:hypothetical protein